MKEEPEIVRILRQEEQVEKLHSLLISSDYELVEKPTESSTDVCKDTQTKMIHNKQRSPKNIELNDLEDSYKIIFENYAVAITLADETERIISWNTYTQDLFRMNEQDLFMRPVSSLYPPKEWKKIRKENIRQKGIKYRLETQMIKKDGEMFDVELSLCILRGAEGKSTGSVGIIKDITKLKKTEKKLHESEERYRIIFENSAVAILLIDDQEKIVSWNNYAEDLLGMKKNDLHNKSIKTLYPQNKWQKIREELLKTKGIHHHVETNIIKKNNEQIDVALSLSILKNQEGKIVGTISVIKDITAQKRIKSILEESEKKFKQLYEKAPVPYHTLSPKGIITNVNEKWCQIFGYKKDEVIGKTIFDFVIPREKKAARASFEKKKKIRNTARRGSERRYLTKTGQERIFVIHDYFSYDSDNKVVSVHTTMDDVTERKQMQKALEYSEKKFKQLYEKAPVPYHTLSPKGIITNVNEKWCQIFGYKKDEVIGRSIFDFILKNERKAGQESFKKKIKSKKTYIGNHERTYLTKSGEERVFMIHDFFSYDKNHNVISVHTIMDDVTERKQTENFLKQSEEKYRAIFDLSPQVIIVLNKNGTILDANSRIKEWLEYSPQEIIGKRITELPFLSSKDKSLAQKKFLQRMEGKEFPAYELDFITKKREKRVGLVLGNVICDARNTIIGDLIVISDVTKRQQEWDNMVKSEEKYRILAETSADGVFTTDALGRLTYVNPSLEKILGKRKSQILATLFRNYLSEGSIYFFQQIFMDVRKQNTPIKNVDLEVVHNDGYEIPIEVNISPLNKDGVFAGLEGTVRDITERKKVERELKKSEQLKTEFMNIAAHELKSPVTPIKGYLELIILDKNTDGKIKEWAQISYRNADRLLKLVNDILDVSRLDTDTMRFTMEKINPVDLVKSAAEDMRLAAEKKNLKFIIDIPKTLPSILGDTNRLAQVLKNLLTNAIKFTDIGSITIRARRQNNMLHIAIQDTGIGISKEETKKVFTKFYQAYTGPDRKNEGAGLGLFICREITKKHHGEITVKSEAGQGSTFTVILPLL